MTKAMAMRAAALGSLLLIGQALAQENNSASVSNSVSQTSASSTSLSGGSALVGNSNNTSGNSFTANITMNQPATGTADPNATQTPKDAGALGSASNPIVNKTELKTVGNPAAMSLAASFSQYNCANSGGIGGGWLGGALSIGGPLESGPCNARANAAALVGLASALPNEDPMKRQLIDAAIRLIGESTSATAAALKQANVGFFTTVVAKTPASPAVQVPSLVNVPGVYVGNDPIVMNRMGLK